ncbi:MAG: glycosyltransferase family 39 protein, partial [Chloroflexota bacterium]
MTNRRVISVFNKRLPLAEALISLGLFLLALFPRINELQRFVTADEAKWVYRSAQFLSAFLQGDFAATTVNLTPAVTTTWLGSLGLVGYYQLNQAVLGVPLSDWLVSVSQFRAGVDVLAATRWPMAIFTSLSIVLIYHLIRQLFDPTTALISAVLIALDPHTTALSRIIGHDAPVTFFMVISVLLLYLAIPKIDGNDNSHSLSLLILSGIAAGFAFLSKAPAFFLVPFTALFLIRRRVWHDNTQLFFWFKRFLIWGAAAYITFTIVWPAAWVDPLGRPIAVIDNAVSSATDQVEAAAETFWLVPDLGPFYYLVHSAFKLSPLVLVGLILALIPIVQQWLKPKQDSGETDTSPTQSSIIWLLIFSLLFALFMTIGGKRSPRYILPIFPALAVVASVGWIQLVTKLQNKQTTQTKNPTKNASQEVFKRSMLPLLLTVAAALTLIPYAPYYFTYFNPLLGGGYTAPSWVKLGWGEGLDQTARFLQQEAPNSRVGTAYASTLSPFYGGTLSDVEARNLDYVVLYRKQLQSGNPSATFVQYFDQFTPVHSTKLNGVTYADVYEGPGLESALALIPGLDPQILPKPSGFRPYEPYGPIGQSVQIDITWLADDPLPTTPSTLTLEPLSSLNISHEGHNHHHGTQDDYQQEEEALAEENKEPVIYSEATGRLSRLANGLVVSQHQLDIP